MKTRPVALHQLSELKQRYLARATAPLDDMWLCGFVPAATHHGFFDGDELVGFYCVNADGFLLQFMLGPGHERHATSLFEALTAQIEGAFVSTAEPDLLAFCLDHFPSFEVHTLMYDLEELPTVAAPQTLPLKTLLADHLDEAVTLAVAVVGAPEGWLRGYYAALIGRGEVHGRWEGDRLVALGETRRYADYFPRHAGLGVMVAEPYRGRGLATRILRQLALLNDARGLASRCSTERDNTGARKAITRAGFIPRHRIIKFEGSLCRPTAASDDAGIDEDQLTTTTEEA